LSEHEKQGNSSTTTPTTAIAIYQNSEFGQIRTLTIHGEPWFVGKDVAEILGYAKPRNAIMSHVDDEDKKDAPIQGALGGTQQMIIINESGLYSLILSSKLPTAKQFKRWVTSEVLPAIRRTGGYGVANDRVLAEITALRAELEATRKTALYAARSVAQPKIKKSRHSEKWRFITDILKKRLRDAVQSRT
jgi:anti-repressor protein